MKYIVFLGDGMADQPVAALQGKTPLQVAHKPNIDRIARKGLAGLVKTVPDTLSPGSDTANMSVMGYDNVSLSRFVEPKLTTMDQNMPQLGRNAAELLIEKIETGRNKTIVLENVLVARDTTGPRGAGHSSS